MNKPGGKKLARPDPLYAQVQREISEAILSGQWERGSQIPGELEIAELYGVSIGTARRALSALVSIGFLERRPRHGTFVADRSPHHNLRFLYHYYRLHGKNDELVVSQAKVLSLQHGTATDEERAKLDFAAQNTSVIRIRRVRSVDGKPVMYEHILLPEHRFPDFPTAEELPNLMFAYFEDKYGIKISSAREKLSAEVASDDDIKYLGLTASDAVLVIDQIAFDTSHAPIEHRVLRAVTNGFRYINEVR